MLLHYHLSFLLPLFNFLNIDTNSTVIEDLQRAIGLRDAVFNTK